MRLAAGSTIGPYEISGPIGAGGMGEVYRARDSRLGREVAIKVLPPQVTADPDRIARFEREARSSSALNHPNIITIHEFGVAGEDRYIVMELVRGESLRDLIARGPVPLKKLFAIATGIAEGLAAAHAAGLVHRDLKPDNLMLTPEGTPKILDFGLVRNAAAPLPGDSPTEVKVTNSGVVLGTMTYMSPEQARGESLEIQSDQFSLGVILHEMATGTHPFRRANPYETLAAINRDEPPPLGENFPDPFVWIVERMLAKSPQERYASTTDLARDLASLRDRLGGGSGVIRSRATTPRSKFPRIALVAAAAAFAVLASFVAVTAWNSRAPKGLVTPLQAQLTTSQVTPQFGEVAIPTTISPDGTLLITAAAGKLWLSDLASGTMKLIAENGFAPAWSNDGRSIAFFADGALKTMPVEGGPARTICKALPEGTPSWHGDTILFAQYSGGPDRAGLYQVSSTGGNPERLLSAEMTPQGAALPWWPQFLPDGKRFLYMVFVSRKSGDGIDHRLLIGSLDGSPSQEVGPIDSRAEFADGHLLYVRDGTLLAHRFDVRSARLEGEGIPLVDNLHYFRSTGMAAFSVSRNGILAWRSARTPVRLAWLDRSGTEIESIHTGLYDSGGRLSPDGSRYAVGLVDARQGINDVWIYDLNRSSSERFTFDLLDQKAPVWAADGQSLYYRSDGQGGPPDILIRGLSEARSRVIHRGPSVEQPEDVSADGRWLLFTIYQGVYADIHVLNLETLETRPFAATPFNEFSPRFSPDGRWVAFASNLSGRSEIYVRPFEGDAAATRVSRDGGTAPRWSRDGKEMYFLGEGGRLMTVPFDGSFGNPRMLFQASDALTFEPDATGERFLVHLAEGTREAPVNLLINWRERLKR
ncbi:MAG TPA: protein kinase [Thermoanaerobaculia bacterium]